MSATRRGPKQRTATNSKATGRGDGLWKGFVPPIDLGGEALAEYRRLLGALEAAGTLEKTDPRIVVRAARTHALIERAESDLAASETITLTAANGTAMPHPMLAVIGSLTMKLRGLWKDMGLTAASAKLGTRKAGESEKASPWAGLLDATG